MHRSHPIRPQPTRTRPTSRILFYTNECVGLGHLRRTLTLAEATTTRNPDASALIITGAPAAMREERHRRIDIIKLPELSRDADGDLRAARLGVDAGHLHDLRAHLAFAAAETFSPSVVVVDKTPLGLNDELVPTLEALRAKRTKIVLGLRDIEDDADAVRRRWDPAARAAIAELYDAVLVYGPPSSSDDALSCLGWEDLDVPVHHVGYVGMPLPSAGTTDLPDGYLLVTAGGGVDGFPVFDAVLRAIERRPLDAPVVMVTGPLMPVEQRQVIERRAAAVGVTTASFRSDMPAVIVGARAVVTMAGYNTVSEVIRAGKPTLLMPRSGPSREQTLRAAALAEQGAAAVVWPDDTSAASLHETLTGLLDAPAPSFDPRDFDGAARAAAVICDLAGQADRPPTSGRALAGIGAQRG